MTDRDTTRRHKNAFLAAYAVQGNVAGAARVAGIHRSDHYRWLADVEYAKRFAEVEEDAIEGLEAEARKRAFAGSDVLLIFLLKASRPSKYRERVDVTLDVRREIERLTTDPLEREAAIAEAERIIASSR